MMGDLLGRYSKPLSVAVLHQRLLLRASLVTLPTALRVNSSASSQYPKSFDHSFTIPSSQPTWRTDVLPDSRHCRSWPPSRTFSECSHFSAFANTHLEAGRADEGLEGTGTRYSGA